MEVLSHTFPGQCQAIEFRSQLRRPPRPSASRPQRRLSRRIVRRRGQHYPSPHLRGYLRSHAERSRQCRDGFHRLADERNPLRHLHAQDQCPKIRTPLNRKYDAQEVSRRGTANERNANPRPPPSLPSSTQTSPALSRPSLTLKRNWNDVNLTLWPHELITRFGRRRFGASVAKDGQATWLGTQGPIRAGWSRGRR